MPKNINCSIILSSLWRPVDSENKTNHPLYRGFTIIVINHHGAKLAKNYKIVPFGFSKIVIKMKGKFNDNY